MQVTKKEFYEARRQAIKEVIEHVGHRNYQYHKNLFVSYGAMPCIFDAYKGGTVKCPFANASIPTTYAPIGEEKYNFNDRLPGVVSLIHVSNIPCTGMGSLPLVKCFAIQRHGNNWIHTVEEHPVGQCPYKGKW